LIKRTEPHLSHTPWESPSLKKQIISVGLPQAQTRPVEGFMVEFCLNGGRDALRNFA
jgi:hypothetical protein